MQRLECHPPVQTLSIVTTLAPVAPSSSECPLLGIRFPYLERKIQSNLIQWPHFHEHRWVHSRERQRLVTKASETVNREPFSVEELKAITDDCAGDDFIRPIIVTGMCTAMRRGDCCLLKWSDVDLQAGFLSVKTAKTGERVDIPIFPMLAEELRRARVKSGKSIY